jgi:hypothetical protein
LVPLLNWPATAIPFERDEGEYLWAAKITARGGIAYRDTFLQKPPGIVLVYQAFLAVTDGTARSIHVLLLGLYVLTAIGIGAIAWKVSGRPMIAAISIILYAFSLSTPLYQANAANTEAFVVAAVVAAVFALLKAHETQSVGWVAALGFSLGLAGVMKQTSFPHALWLLPAVGFSASAGKRRFQWPLVAAAMAAVVLAVVSIPYVIAGAGREMLDGIVWHNFEYSGAKLERAFYGRFDPAHLDIRPFHLALWLTGLIGLSILIYRRRRWPVVVLGGWLASAVLGASVGASFRGHYFTPVLPATCILAAIAIVSSPIRIRRFVAPIFLVYWALSNGFQWNRDRVELANQRYHTNFFEDAVLVGDWLSKKSDRSLYVVGSEPEIYYYADARSVSRYVISNPLFGGFASSPARQHEVWSAIEDRPPKWIVTIYPLVSIPFFPGSDPELLNRVKNLLFARYTPRVVALHERIALVPVAQVHDRRIEDMTVWERKY